MLNFLKIVVGIYMSVAAMCSTYCIFNPEAYKKLLKNILRESDSFLSKFLVISSIIYIIVVLSLFSII